VTNHELLKAPRQTLNPQQRQRQFVLRRELTAVLCPACLKPVDALAAAGIDVEASDFGGKETNYCCPHCAARLERITLPLAAAGAWHWRLDHDWLLDRLHKARLYEREHSSEAGESGP
jgi:hypothetical protein